MTTQPNQTAAAEKPAPREFVRFKTSQRIEHWVLVATFTLLAVTGLAQKYYTGGVAEWLVLRMGGIEMTRLIHRILGVIFTCHMLWHIAYLFNALAIKKSKPVMMPTVQDVKDIGNTFKRAFGLRKKPVLFGRFDYRQKFEYWGIIFGGTIMTLTGYILIFPVAAARILPGQFIAAAREMHGNEATLAVLTIIVWHLYDVIFKPGIFPADTVMFTGKISRERMIEEHALEYAEVTGERIEDVEREAA